MRADCPNCGRTIRAPDSANGKRVRCPSCDHPFKLEVFDVAVVDDDDSTATVDDDADVAERDDSSEVEDEAKPARKRRKRRGQPHRGTLILVLGILSLVVLPFILGPIAWTMGTTDLKKMREGVMDREGEQNTNIGRTCGMIGTILGFLCCGGYAISFIFFLAADAR